MRTQYRIIGANRETGEDVDMTVESSSVAGVERCATKQGILVSSIDPILSDLDSLEALRLAGEQVEALRLATKQALPSSKPSTLPPPSYGAQPLRVVNGINGQIELYQDKIRIKRKGFISLLQHGAKGDKDIRIESINSIELKMPGIREGYIQFAFSGGKEAKGGQREAVKDENTVTFGHGRQKQEFLSLRDDIDRLRTTSRPASRRSSSPLDDLEKLADLRDRGVLTPEEFEAKKRQLLHADHAPVVQPKLREIPRSLGRQVAPILSEHTDGDPLTALQAASQQVRRSPPPPTTPPAVPLHQRKGTEGVRSTEEVWTSGHIIVCGSVVLLILIVVGSSGSQRGRGRGRESYQSYEPATPKSSYEPTVTSIPFGGSGTDAFDDGADVEEAPKASIRQSSSAANDSTSKLTGVDNGYAWKKASDDVRMILCQDFARRVSGPDWTYYYHGLNAAYNTNEHGILRQSIAEMAAALAVISTE